MVKKLNFNRIRLSVSGKLRNVHIPIDIILSIIFLGLILAVLSVSLFRKIEEGRNNYGVYLAEEEALRKLVAENEGLKKELSYYDSIEYKLLYARDSLNTVRPGEKLYELDKPVVTYEYKPDTVTIYSQLEPWQVWWHLLFSPDV